MTPELEKSLDHAKLAMMRSGADLAFTTTLLLMTETYWSEAAPTAWTNGETIGINPVFWGGLTKGQQKFVLYHEVEHIARLHTCVPKNGGLNFQKWNIAADHEINLNAKELKFELVPDIYCDEQYTDMTAETIYRLLPEEGEKTPGSGSGSGSSMGDDLHDDPAINHGADAQRKIGQKIAQAATITEMAGGTVPEHIKRHLEKVRNPKLPWNVLLENYMTSFMQEGYSWSKPNRRYPADFMPSLCSEGMGPIKIYEDLSGSISQKEHSIQVAEMRYIQELCNPSEMTFNGFSHFLGKTHHYDQGEEIDPSFDMTGGTSILVVLDDIKEHEPEVAIIFTDGEFPEPEGYSLTTQIVWVIVNNSYFEIPACLKGNSILTHMDIK